MSAARGDLSYAPQNISFGPVSGMSNLSQLQFLVQATATGRFSDSIFPSLPNLNSPAATVSGYDAGM
jgi:hypothetical protein